MEPILSVMAPVMNLFNKASHASLIFVRPEIENGIRDFSLSTGLGDSEIRYLGGLLIAYPLALIHSYLPSPALKHLWSGIWGVAIAQIVFGADWFHTFISTTIAYLIIVLGPRKNSRFIVFAFMLGYLAMSHIYRIYVDWMGWRLDFTSAQMMLCTKFTVISFNLYDGTIGKAEIDSDIADAEKKGDKKKVKMLQDRLSRSCTSIPSPLVVFGFCFNFSSYLAGPAFELSEYVNTSNGKFGKETGRPGGRIVAGLFSLLKGLICIGLWLVLSKKYSSTKLYEKDTLDLPLFEYFIFAWLCMFANRMKYYFAWLVGEGSCQFCGFGFNGRTKEGAAKWDGVNNIDVLGVELGLSMRDYTNKWNKNTQAWLQRYVYDRTNNSLIAVYMVSAFWHGFYPGYYLFFLSVPLGTEVQREFFRKLRPRAMADPTLKMIYDFLGYICTSLICNYLALAFTSLSYENVMICWSRFYFSGHILMVALVLVMKVVPMPSGGKGKKEE